MPTETETLARVHALRRITTLVKGAVVEAGERGTLVGDDVRWDSMPFTLCPGLAEDVDYAVADGPLPPLENEVVIPATRVRARLALGGADKGTIVRAGTLGWRGPKWIVWDSHPQEPFAGLREGREYDVVPGDPPAGTLSASERERLALDAAARVKRAFDQCCALASSGDDFHERWEAAMREQTTFLAELHRIKSMPW